MGNAEKNTVSAEKQVDKNVYIYENKGKIRVLFIGNSITRHRPKKSIGWEGDWGMAASCAENDYVHRTVRGIENNIGPVDYCVAQLAEWETRYFEGDTVLNEYYSKAKEFNADIIIVRLGENINREKNKEINCKPYYSDMIKFFRTKDTAKVIVTDNFWKIDVLDKIFREVSKENGYIFCQINDLEQDEKTMAKGLFEHHGVSIHPSDYGMKCIAERILDKIF